jgi:alpha-tubulin suppressor-like RCC1 family protein
VGESLQASATALNSTGGVLSGRSVSWSSSNAAIASVSASGLISALAAGDITLQAMVDSKSGQISLKVTLVPISSLTVSPPTATLPVGQAMALAATAKDSAGNGLSGRTITWATSDQNRATVSATGVVIGLAAGTVDVIATAEGMSGSTKIEVTPVVSTTPVATVTVSIPRTAFRIGENIQAAALPLDASGGVLTGRTITWSSSNSEIASVSPGGLVTGVAPGVATISADVEGKTGTATLLLSLVPVASVTINPGTEAVSAGATVALTAILKDSADRVLTGRPIAWTSSNSNTASVSGAGVVTGILVGTVDIAATVEGKQGHASVTVNTLSTAVATVTVTPGNTAMSGGGTKQLTATLRDANGNVLGGRTVTWSLSNPSRATISSTGLVTASPVDAPVVVTATAEGKSGTAAIDIHTFVKMSVGAGFSCGVTADGTAFCWGVNNQAQLGDGTLSGRLTPTKVSTDVKFVTISSGLTATCGIAQNGFVYCWGANEAGQLGNGTSGKNSSIPVLVSGGYTFVSVATTGGTTCATTSDQDVYCWGIIGYAVGGDIGDVGIRRIQSTPLRIGAGMVAVVASLALDLDGYANQFCSVDQVGLAYCWSVIYVYNGLSPIIRDPVSSTYHFTTLRMGFYHVCGLVASGQAYCWGRNDLGQLGDGTTISRTSPTLVVEELLFESLAAGSVYATGNGITVSSGFSCGITPAGKAYCWGSNAQGQLGIDSQTQSALTPQAVAGGISFTGMRAGPTHVCGLAIGGAAYCWGSNASGQFGDGSTTSSSKPTQVFGN